jgi:hypothetical protein
MLHIPNPQSYDLIYSPVSPTNVDTEFLSFGGASDLSRASLLRALPNFVPIAEIWLDIDFRTGERELSSAIAQLVVRLVSMGLWRRCEVFVDDSEFRF